MSWYTHLHCLFIIIWNKCRGLFLNCHEIKRNPARWNESVQERCKWKRHNSSCLPANARTLILFLPHSPPQKPCVATGEAEKLVRHAKACLISHDTLLTLKHTSYPFSGWPLHTSYFRNEVRWEFFLDAKALVHVLVRIGGVPRHGETVAHHILVHLLFTCICRDVQ